MFAKTPAIEFAVLFVFVAAVFICSLPFPVPGYLVTFTNTICQSALLFSSPVSGVPLFLSGANSKPEFNFHLEITHIAYSFVSSADFALRSIAKSHAYASAFSFQRRPRTQRTLPDVIFYRHGLRIESCVTPTSMFIEVAVLVSSCAVGCLRLPRLNVQAPLFLTMIAFYKRLLKAFLISRRTTKETSRVLVWSYGPLRLSGLYAG